MTFLEILGLDVTCVEKTEMRGVDISFEALQPVALAL
jgi:hypothetical protein